MFDQHLQQLASQDAATRRQAIIALGKSGDPQALPALANVYRNDPDPTLRELALKAGRYIKGLTTTTPGVTPDPARSATNAASPTASTPPFSLSGPMAEPGTPTGSALTLVEPRTVSPVSSPAFSGAFEILDPLPSTVGVPLPGQKQVSEYHRKLAAGKLDSAIGLISRGENTRGEAELMNALRYDPSIAKNTIAMNLAATITGIYSPDAAIQDVVRRMEEARAKDKPRGGQSINLGSILAEPDLLEMLIMLILLFLILCGVGYAGRYVLQNSAAAMAKLGATRDSSQLNATLATITPAQIFTRGFVLTFSALIDTIVLYAVGIALGGTAIALHFLKVLLRVDVVVSLLLAIGLVGVAYGFTSVIGDKTGPGTAVFIAGAALIAVSSLGGLIWEGVVVIREHHVGFFKGLLIVLVGGFATSIVNLLIR